MASVDHTYSYLAPSAVAVEDGHAEVTLATSGGKAVHPFFFSGFLGSPRQTAQGLLVVAEVARTRYYEPPQMVAARIRAADPVVTSNVDRLRFESFSACAGVYARLDLDPESLKGAPAEWGTTNVDFNPPMRAALARVQVASAQMLLRHELQAVEARRFLQSLPRTKSRAVAWATPAGKGLRLSAKASDAAICFAGPERL